MKLNIVFNPGASLLTVTVVKRLELLTTFTLVVMFLFFSSVLTSPKSNSPFLVPIDVIATPSEVQVVTVNL